MNAETFDQIQMVAKVDQSLMSFEEFINGDG